MMFGGIYRDRRVLISGHSGFKGAHLACWLEQLGAKVYGYALPPVTDPALFPLLELPVTSIWGDLRNRLKLRKAFLKFRPEIVFHLAAQPLVRASFRQPAETFEINVQGTVNLLECCRACESVRAVVVVTSDKCYRNRETTTGYRENDPMGGFDPYSASKGCAELVSACYRDSFFSPEGRVLLATARAGNVVGGGDWAEDRLIPDLIRAAAADRVEVLRRPDAVRPWQHVWEPLSGYLLLGQKLLEGKKTVATAWNFGPTEEDAVCVRDVARKLSEAWPAVRFECADTQSGPHEAGLLRLDCRRARRRLGWQPVWDLAETLKRTAAWYRAFYEQGAVRTREDLEAYVATATEKDLAWTH